MAAFRTHTAFVLALVVAMVGESTFSWLLADAIKLKNGNSIEGKVLVETADEVMIKTRGGGVVTIARKQISSVMRSPVKPKRPKKAGLKKKSGVEQSVSKTARVYPTKKVSGKKKARKPLAAKISGWSSHSFGSGRIQLPKGFVKVVATPLPGQAATMGKNLGEFKDPYGVTVTVVRLNLPPSLPAKQFENLIWENFKSQAQKDPQLVFKRGKLSGHRVIFGDLPTTESGSLLHVVSAYVFGHSSGMYLYSISVPRDLYQRQSKTYDRMRSSFRFQ